LTIILELFYIVLYYYILYKLLFLVGNPEEKRPLGRHRRRWEDIIKTDLQKVGCGVWTESSWLRLGIGGEHV